MRVVEAIRVSPRESCRLSRSRMNIIPRASAPLDDERKESTMDGMPTAQEVGAASQTPFSPDQYWASIERKLQRALALARSGDHAGEGAWLSQARAVADRYLGPVAARQLADRVAGLQAEGLLSGGARLVVSAPPPPPRITTTAHPGGVAAQAGVQMNVSIGQPSPADVGRLFRFDGGAATWFGVQVAGFLVTLCTLGICYPWSVVMVYRWKAKHTYLQGRQLRFTGDAWSLFGQWIKWFLLCCITFGFYSFWVYPRMTRWIVEHQEFAR